MSSFCMNSMLTRSTVLAANYKKTHSSILNTIRNIVKRNPELSEEFIEDTYRDSRNISRPCFYVTYKGEQIINNKFNLNSRSASLEYAFLDVLEDALKPFKIYGERQYKVLNYRIDFYIPSLKIAIEYDENNHSNYSYEDQELRQSMIQKELGCKFIRVSDKNSHFYNVGLILKELK